MLSSTDPISPGKEMMFPLSQIFAMDPSTRTNSASLRFRGMTPRLSISVQTLIWFSTGPSTDNQFLGFHQLSMCDPEISVFDSSGTSHHVHHSLGAHNGTVQVTNRSPSASNLGTGTFTYSGLCTPGGLDQSLSCNTDTCGSDSYQDLAGSNLERAYKCIHAGCNWSFTRKGDMERHTRTHGPPLYFGPVDECKYCTKGFTRKDKRDSHARTHRSKK